MQYIIGTARGVNTYTCKHCNQTQQPNTTVPVNIFAKLKNNNFEARILVIIKLLRISLHTCIRYIYCTIL